MPERSRHAWSGGLQNIHLTRVTVAGQDSAGPFSDAIVGVVIVAFEDLENLGTILRGRAVTQDVQHPAAHFRIGVAGHLKDSRPDFAVVGFQFAGAEHVKGFAPELRIGAAGQFEPFRYFTLWNSHSQRALRGRRTGTGSAYAKLSEVPRRRSLRERRSG